MKNTISRRGFISTSAGLIGLLMTSHLSTAEDNKDDLGKWERKADMPSSRVRLMPCVEGVEGKLYVIGGYSHFPYRGYYVDVYDPKTDIWTKLNPKPKFSFTNGESASAVIDNCIYVVGGIGAGTLPEKMEVYDPKTDKWARLKDMPSDRRGFGVSAINDKLYVAGGNRFNNEGTLEVYDPKTDKWVRLKDMTSDRAGLKAVTIEGKLYAVGGFSKYQDSSTLMEMYDPKTDTWARLPDMPTGRWDFGVGVINDKLYVLGGGSEGGKSVSSVDVFDTKTLKWLKGLDMLTSKRGVRVGIIDNKLYVVGGDSGGIFGSLPNLEVFTHPQ